MYWVIKNKNRAIEMKCNEMISRDMKGNRKGLQGTEVKKQ